MIMKNIFRFLAVASAFAGLVSCVKYAEYTTTSYASVDASSVKIIEPAVDASAVTYKFPVHVYNATSDCSVSYEIKDVTAKQGVDYTIVNGTGVLSFPKGVETQEIEFTITGQPGTFTGDVSFQVILKEATNNVVIGAISAAKITIADKDHPLVSLFGEYNLSAVFSNAGGYSYTTWSLNITEYVGDVTRVWLDNLVFYAYQYPGDFSGTPQVYGIVSDDMKTITIPTPQDTGVDCKAGWNFGDVDYEVWLYRTSKLSFEVDQTPIVFTLQEDGTYTTDADYAFNVPSKEDAFPYYYGNVISTFNPNYPTVLKKAN